MINVPDEYFPDFLRGIIDGDGSIEVRMVDGKAYLRVRAYSASEPFINWIHNICQCLFHVKGGGLHQYKNRPYWGLSYSHYDSLKIIKCIYSDAKYFLQRKRKKCEHYLDK